MIIDTFRTVRPDRCWRRRLVVCTTLAIAIFGLVPIVHASESANAPPVALETLVEEALARNPEIRAARLEHEAALARRAPAGALEDPVLEFGVVNAALPFSLSHDDMTMQMLGLSQKLSFPGKRRLREAVAGADADAIGFAVAETTHRVLRDLRLAYANLRLADRESTIAHRTGDTLQALAAFAAARYAVGRASQADVLQAGAHAAAVQQDLLRIDADRQTADSEIRRLTGRPDTATPIVPLPGTAQLPPPASASARSERPQLAALRAMETRGELEISLAERDYYPDVELRLNYGHRDRSLNGLPRDDLVTMTVAVSLPLWRKERLAPRVAEARALRARAAALTEEQRLETRAGIEQQFARAEQARATLALYRSALLPQTHAASEATRTAWENSSSDFSAVLDTRLREYEAALAEANVITAYERAVAELYFLQGINPSAASAPGALP